MTSDAPSVTGATATFPLSYAPEIAYGPFPVTYKHQPDAGDYMTLKSYLKRRTAAITERSRPGQRRDPRIIPFSSVSDSVPAESEPRNRRVG